MRERRALQGNATRSGYSCGRSVERRASAGKQIGRTYCEQVIAHNRECRPRRVRGVFGAQRRRRRARADRADRENAVRPDDERNFRMRNFPPLMARAGWFQNPAIRACRTGSSSDQFR
jgi:hypothetical protein